MAKPQRFNQTSMIELEQDIPITGNPFENFKPDFFPDFTEAVFITDLNGKILNTDGSFTKNFATDPDQFLNADVHDRLPSIVHSCLFDDIAKLKRIADEALRTGKPVNIELFQDNITWKLTTIPIRSLDGAVSHLLFAVHKIDKKKQPESENCRNLAAITALYDTIPASIIIVNSNMRLIGWNRFSRDTINGRSDEEMPSVNPFERVHPDDISDLAERLFLNIINCGTEESAEFRMFHKNGPPYKWARVRAKKAIIEGQPCMVAVVTEITELKQAEEKQKKLQAQLMQYQKMELIGELAGGIAHDFNNALTAILGNTELILNKLDNSCPFIDNIRDINTLATRSAKLTRQLLAFARKQIVLPKAIDLNDFISGFLPLYQRLIGNHIDFEWRPSINQAVVLFDPTQLDQILSNLIFNARDAIKDCGKILVECDLAHFDIADHSISRSGIAPGDYIRISIGDTGSGIDAKILPHIYEPFFTTKSVGRGTGLGLSTVYGIVMQNKGFIECRTESGKGTTFDIYLPRHEDSVQEVKSDTKAPANTGKKQTILVVEDEPYILKLIKDILESHHFTVITSRDAEECMLLNKKSEFPIDLIITDVVLPTMNGVQLSALLEMDNPTLKVLFMSAYAPENISHEKQFEEGVNFIRKPFSINDFIMAINKVLAAV